MVAMMTVEHLLVLLATFARRIQDLEIDNQRLRQQIADSDMKRIREAGLTGDPN